MKDLSDARWIKLKGILFLCLGAAASVLLLLELPTVKTGLLLALAVWGFCRAYYFAFYVIERYVDSSFRFSGIGSALAYLLKRK